MDSITLTPNLKLSELPANYHVWAKIMNTNLVMIDAAVNSFVELNGLRGAWSNSIHYYVGDVIIDAVSATMWQCQVDHISQPIPTTFLQDRTNHPTYWTTFSAPATARGVWTGPGTAYSVNDFVVHGQQYAVCIQANISTSSFDADVASGYWSVIIDLTLAGQGLLYVGDTAPANAGQNALWWNSAMGQLFILYNDGDSVQWVPATPPGVAPVQSQSVVSGGTINMTTSGEVIVTGTGATTVYLPLNVLLGTLARVSDGGSGASISVFAPSGGTINGNIAAHVMSYAWQSTLFRSLGNNNWSML
jgi:hypothetical protein